MTRTRHPALESQFVYVYDKGLDDSVPWQSGTTTCEHCGFSFHYHRRYDRPMPCPRCHVQPKWLRNQPPS